MPVRSDSGPIFEDSVAFSEAKICTILLPLRCSFRWYPCLPKSFRSDFSRNPWTIVRCFDQISLRAHNSSLEGAMKLKSAPFCSP